MSQKKKRRKKKYRLKKEVKRKLQIIAVLFSLISLIVLVFTAFGSRQKDAAVSQGVWLDEALGVPVIQQIIPEGSQNRPGMIRKIRWIVIHETDNFEASADARHHADYLCENKTEINSWHYTVDEAVIVHTLPDEEVGWHAGDQQTPGGGNMSGIGIEMCVNEGNDFSKTLDNTAKLVAVLLKQYGLSLKAVQKHQDFSGKDCPAHLLKEADWQQFLDQIQAYYDQLE